MNITLSIDERVAEQARQAASAMGKSLNQAVRDYLEKLAGQAQLESEIKSFVASTKKSPGKLGGWKIDREEMHRRA
jgi:antitoxin component of RelBE/YafQ-DinJ toxin-antitoxin module